MPRLRLHLLLATAAVMLVAAAPAARGDVVFVANMTNSQENPPVTPPGPASFGTATFVLNDTQTMLSFTATVFNIDINSLQTPNDPTDNLTAAHIHAAAPIGSNVGVVWGFFGTPDNDNNPDSLTITPFANGVGGTFTSVWNQPEGNNTTLTAQIPNLLAGLAYINFHTARFPGGEVRGQIQAVPEPATILLLATGLGVGAAIRKRRNKSSRGR